MEGQGKRLILAVTLALGILLLWNVLFPPEKPKPRPPAAEVEKPSWQSPTGQPSTGAEGGSTNVAAPVVTAAEQTFELAYPNFVATFSSKGARLVSWRLTEKKWARDWMKGEMIADPTRGALAVNFVDSTVVLPVDAVWEAEQPGPNVLRFTYRSALLEVVKTFTVHPEAYMLDLAVEMKSLADGELKQRLAMVLVGAQDPKAPVGGGTGQSERQHRATCHLNGSLSGMSAKSLHANGPRERGGTVRYAGFFHPYLLLAVIPRDATRENMQCNAYPLEDIPGGMEVDLVFQVATLRKGEPATKKEVVAYIGPRYLSQLENADSVAGFSTGLADTIDMGWFSFIARPLSSLLLWFQTFTHNWAISIILLTLLVKLATLYWTTKSMRSMKAMAALAPQMKELQAKYGDDKQKIQQEMMGLYKTHGVNPLAGCLPMLLQMPIWLALYRMLSTVGELYLSPAIPGWIDDLTATDPFHILPIALMGLMFLQSRITPATLDSMQQKILMYGLPLMFGVMSFFFPAGLTIYILTNTILSILHSLYMKHFDHSAKSPLPTKKPAAAAAAAAKGASPREQARKRDERDAEAPKAKPVIDVESREADEGDEGGEADEASDDDGGDEDEAPAKPSPAKGGPGPTNKRPNAQRRGKRKRGKN